MSDKESKSKGFTSKKYISCEEFAEKSGLTLEYVRQNFATHINDSLIVPAFMLDSQTKTVKITRSDSYKKSNKNTNTLASISANVSIEVESMKDHLTVTEIPSQNRINFDELDSAYISKMASANDDFIDSDKSHKDSAARHAAEDQNGKPTTANNGEKATKAIYAYALLACVIIGLALFVYKFPPAHNLVMDKLVEFGVLRQL